MVDRRVNKDRRTLNDRRVHQDAPDAGGTEGPITVSATSDEPLPDDQRAVGAGRTRSGNLTMTQHEAPDDLSALDLRAPAHAD